MSAFLDGLMFGVGVVGGCALTVAAVASAGYFFYRWLVVR